MATRLEILQQSLEKKQKAIDEKFDRHFADVRQANGQPLNDKRNGRATLNRWEKQSDSIRNAEKELEKTRAALEREQYKVSGVEHINKMLPKQILDLVNSGVLNQWRKHPNMFFVNGVDKARIIWDLKKKELTYKYLGAITDKDQYRLFVRTLKDLHASIITDKI